MSVPEWLEYVNAGGTAVAALLAAGAIVQTARNSNQNQKALLRERRVDFELDVLAKLAELTLISNQGLRTLQMKAQAAMLDAELIPLTRAALMLDSTDAAKRRVEETSEERREHRQSPVEFFKQEITAEILAAVRKRLAERH